MQEKLVVHSIFLDTVVCTYASWTVSLCMHSHCSVLQECKLCLQAKDIRPAPSTGLHIGCVRKYPSMCAGWCKATLIRP